MVIIPLVSGELQLLHEGKQNKIKQNNTPTVKRDKEAWSTPPATPAYSQLLGLSLVASDSTPAQTGGHGSSCPFLQVEPVAKLNMYSRHRERSDTDTTGHTRCFQQHLGIGLKQMIPVWQRKEFTREGTYTALSKFTHIYRSTEYSVVPALLTGSSSLMSVSQCAYPPPSPA